MLLLLQSRLLSNAGRNSLRKALTTASSKDHKFLNYYLWMLQPSDILMEIPTDTEIKVVKVQYILYLSTDNNLQTSGNVAWYRGRIYQEMLRKLLLLINNCRELYCSKSIDRWSVAKTSQRIARTTSPPKKSMPRDLQLRKTNIFVNENNKITCY